MGNKIFRQKSIDKMQSPDNLKEYIKVINPSLWIVFTAVFFILIGAFVWGTFGQIEEKISISATVHNGVVSCDFNDYVEKDMNAVVNGLKGKVSSVTSSGITIALNETIPDGNYSGYIVLEKISPISFVFN